VAIGGPVGQRTDARANAAAEAITVELVTADMRALPLATGPVDVVVSSLAIHNIPDDAEDECATGAAGPGGPSNAVSIFSRSLGSGGARTPFLPGWLKGRVDDPALLTPSPAGQLIRTASMMLLSSGGRFPQSPRATVPL